MLASIIVQGGNHQPMTSEINAPDQQSREKQLIDLWINSANRDEIGLLDLAVLDGWIAQLETDGGTGSSQ